MDKRYQVFISSTFKDLQEERQEVIQALLELDCIPSGMELFPAANDDQWTLIKKVIDDCDYYIVIIGGRYGTIGPQGISYTEMEYRYALEKGIPIIAFLHKNPGEIPANRTEDNQEGKEKLVAFRELVQQKMVKTWTTPVDLGSVVSRSLIWLIKNNPAIGWVKSDKLPNEESTLEILNLRKQVENLEKKLSEVRTTAPTGIENLSQGEDIFKFDYIYKETRKDGSFRVLRSEFGASWNKLFSLISPVMINEGSESDLQVVINAFITKSKEGTLEKGLKMRDTQIVTNDFRTLIVQFKALGLIEQSKKGKSVKDMETYWTLTLYGDSMMTKLRAIKKDVD